MEADTSSDQRPVIPASEILAKIKRGEDVEYDGVIIEGDLDISGLELPTEHVHRTEDEKIDWSSDKLQVIRSQIIITNSEIQGNVNFSNALFQRSICFDESKFGPIVSFLGSIFGGKADFFCTKFVVANFAGDVFGGDANFWGAMLGAIASFDRAKFIGGAIFHRAEFGGHASFNRAMFNDYAEFWATVFNWHAEFSGAKFTSNTNFGSAKFIGAANFEEAEFGGNANFDHDQFSTDVSFKDTKFSTPTSQAVACRIVKRKMENQGNKKAADDYFYREMEAIRLGNGIKGTEKMVWPWKMQISKWLKLVGSKVWRLGRYDLFEYVFVQGIFGYGVHPLRLFAFWILMAFAFAAFYWYFDAVEDASAWVDYIWFSIATSATPGYALYNPIGHYKIVTGIQAIIGTFMWAAFIATFARKWQR